MGSKQTIYYCIAFQHADESPSMRRHMIWRRPKHVLDDRESLCKKDGIDSDDLSSCFPISIRPAITRYDDSRHHTSERYSLMSYTNGEGGPPYPPTSRTGSISYAPSSSSNAGGGGLSMNYFQSEAQQQQRSNQQPLPSAHMPYPMQQQQQPHHRMPWPASTSTTSNTLPQPIITSDLPGDSKRHSSLLVESPVESRSDTDDPAQGTPGNGASGSLSSVSKRKMTDDPDGSGSRSKKKRNRAVLSCAPCKARKVSL